MPTKAQRNQVVSWKGTAGNCSEAKKEVDEYRETLHNLSSLLLTNKTIRRTQQGSTEQSSLKINSR
jgi:hypothetical protein